MDPFGPRRVPLLLTSPGGRPGSVAAPTCSGRPGALQLGRDSLPGSPSHLSCSDLGATRATPHRMKGRESTAVTSWGTPAARSRVLSAGRKAASDPVPRENETREKRPLRFRRSWIAMSPSNSNGESAKLHDVAALRSGGGGNDNSALPRFALS